MKNVIIILITLITVISCNSKKDSYEYKEISILEGIPSFMGIRIGMPADSALAYIKSTPELNYNEYSTGELFFYPHYQRSGTRFEDYDFELGERIAVFNPSLAFSDSEDQLCTVVYAKDNKVVRVVSSTYVPFSQKEEKFARYWCLYNDKYGKGISIYSKEQFFEEKDSPRDEYATFKGVMYKYKNSNNRIFFVYDFDKKDDQLFIVYEDATDYYNFQKSLKAQFHKEEIDNRNAEERARKIREEKAAKQDI